MNEVAKEFTMLAQLIGASSADSETKKDNFKLNLFPNQTSQGDGQGKKGGSSADDDQTIIQIDLTENRQQQKAKLSSVTKDLAGFGIDDGDGDG